jgi:hypothetical protein
MNILYNEALLPGSSSPVAILTYVNVINLCCLSKFICRLVLTDCPSNDNHKSSLNVWVSHQSDVLDWFMG